ncbi:MAG: glycine cleavage system protein H [Chloroflexi bacterium]|nr:glycine cleavage system protein H [Chloroflexota bacterium]
MAEIRKCEFPDDLYYDVERHAWAKVMDSGNIRVGVTAPVGTLSGGELAAVTPRKKRIGKEINAGKSIATLESSKYVGPVNSPVTGTLVAVNDEQLKDNPNLLISDPYGEGWVAEFEVPDWDAQKEGLLTGEAAQEAYRNFLESEDVSCG